MKNGNLLIHLILAAAVSFAISGGAWFFAGIFNFTGLWVASLGAAFLGVAIGWASGRYLAVTLAATIILRSAILFIAING